MIFVPFSVTQLKYISTCLWILITEPSAAACCEHSAHSKKTLHIHIVLFKLYALLTKHQKYLHHNERWLYLVFMKIVQTAWHRLERVALSFQAHTASFFLVRQRKELVMRRFHRRIMCWQISLIFMFELGIRRWHRWFSCNLTSVCVSIFDEWESLYPRHCYQSSKQQIFTMWRETTMGYLIVWVKANWHWHKPFESRIRRVK